eukprot:Hpha_TRINITY_DN20024_c0_g1::TRINITY_DN20024_c0_g1_i2::g.147789::m.147789
MYAAGDVLRIQLVLETLLQFVPLNRLHPQIAGVCANWLVAATHALNHHLEPHLHLLGVADNLRVLVTAYYETLLQAGLIYCTPVVEYIGDDRADHALWTARCRAMGCVSDFGRQVWQFETQIVGQLRLIRSSVSSLQIVARDRTTRLHLPEAERAAFEEETRNMRRCLMAVDVRLKNLARAAEGNAYVCEETTVNASDMVSKITGMYQLPSAKFDHSENNEDDDDSKLPDDLPAEA